jgi:hypothetical protein
MPSPSVTQDNVQEALVAFLTAVTTVAAEDVVEGQDNRVPEPEHPDFIVMWPTGRPRLATNLDSSDDVRFTGSIAGTTMTVTTVAFGSISAGATLFGTGVVANTKVVSGPGGAGSYVVDTSQTLASTTLSCGATDIEQDTEVLMQLDVHGPNSADNAQVISMLMRDPYGVTFFEGLDLGVTPLHADDPKQVPFVNDQNQFENRWIVEARLQVNPVVSVPQQYADSATVTPISVTARFPS